MAEVSEILTLGLMLFIGYALSFLLNKIHVPGLVGMMVLGVFIGPEFLNWISEGILNISSELRSMALTIILAQSGLHLDLDSLKKVGRPAILLSILPATFEIIGCMVGSKLLLDFTYAEGLTLGAVLGSVSPAIIACRMIRLIELRIGEKHSVPKLILAGAGCDDIFTIILFYAFLNIVGSSGFDWKTILGIPMSIITGTILGLICGFLVVLFYIKTNLDLPTNTLVIFSVSLLLNGLEHLIDSAKEGTKCEWMSVSGLLGVIVTGIFILNQLPERAHELSGAFTSIWKFFEIILFVLVGATMIFDEDLKNNLGKAILVLLIGLAFRTVGTYLAMVKTELTLKEKIYIIVTFISKATVQASIGGVALAREYDCGQTILTVSVISIILTAPFGSAWMEFMGPVLLDKATDENPEKQVDVKDSKEVKLDNENKGKTHNGDGENKENDTDNQNENGKQKKKKPGEIELSPIHPNLNEKESLQRNNINSESQLKDSENVETILESPAILINKESEANNKALDTSQKLEI